MNAMLDEKMLEMLKWCEGPGEVEDEPGTLYKLTAQEQQTLVAVKVKMSLDNPPDDGDPPDHPSKRIDKLLGRAQGMLFDDEQFEQAYQDVKSIRRDHPEFSYYKADLVKLLDLEKKLRELGFSLEDSALYDILTVRKMVQSYPLCSRFLGLRAAQGELVKPTRDMRKALKSLQLLEPDNPWSVQQAITDLRGCHYTFEGKIVSGLINQDVPAAILAPLVVAQLVVEGEDQGTINNILGVCGMRDSDSLLYKSADDNWKNTLALFLKHYKAKRKQGPQHKGYRDRRYEWEVRIGFSRDEKIEAVSCLLAKLEQSGGQSELDSAALRVIMQPHSDTRQIMMKNLPERLKQGGIAAIKAAVIAALCDPAPSAPDASPESGERDHRERYKNGPE